MKEWRDDEGRPWRIALTVSTLLRVRDTVSVEIETEDEDGNKSTRTVPLDLADIGTISQTLTALKLQYARLGEILWAIVSPQAEAKQITRDQFLDGLRGDSLEAAAAAVEEELIAFFPQRHRRVVQLMVEKYDELTASAVTAAEEQMQSVVASGMPSGRPQGSSASTQANGRGGSSKPRATPASKRTGGTLPTSSA